MGLAVASSPLTQRPLHHFGVLLRCEARLDGRDALELLRIQVCEAITDDQVSESSCGEIALRLVPQDQPAAEILMILLELTWNRQWLQHTGFC